MANSPGEVAEAYFTCMRNGESGVAALFHEASATRRSRHDREWSAGDRRVLHAVHCEHGPGAPRGRPAGVEGNRVLAEVYIDLTNGVTQYTSSTCSRSTTSHIDPSRISYRTTRDHTAIQRDLAEAFEVAGAPPSRSRWAGMKA